MTTETMFTQTPDSLTLDAENTQTASQPMPELQALSFELDFTQNLELSTTPTFGNAPRKRTRTIETVEKTIPSVEQIAQGQLDLAKCAIALTTVANQIAPQLANHPTLVGLLKKAVNNSAKAANAKLRASDYAKNALSDMLGETIEVPKAHENSSKKIVRAILGEDSDAIDDTVKSLATVSFVANMHGIDRTLRFFTKVMSARGKAAQQGRTYIHAWHDLSEAPNGMQVINAIENGVRQLWNTKSEALTEMAQKQIAGVLVQTEAQDTEA